MDHLINWTLLHLAPRSYDSYCSAQGKLETTRSWEEPRDKRSLGSIMNTINDNIVWNRTSKYDYFSTSTALAYFIKKNTVQVEDITVNLSLQLCLEKIQFLPWTTMNHYCEPLNWNNNFGNNPASQSSPDKWDKLYSVLSTGRQAVWTQTSDLV